MRVRRNSTAGQVAVAMIGEGEAFNYSEWRRFCRVFFGRKLVIFGTLVILVFVVFAVFAPLIAPYEPNDQNLRAVTERPSREHFLGTDQLGRDTLSRIIYGSRISLLIGVSAVALGSVVGMLLGLIAGFFGGWLNHIIMRVMDALMAFPMIGTAGRRRVGQRRAERSHCTGCRIDSRLGEAGMRAGVVGQRERLHPSQPIHWDQELAHYAVPRHTQLHAASHSLRHHDARRRCPW